MNYGLTQTLHHNDCLVLGFTPGQSLPNPNIQKLADRLKEEGQFLWQSDCDGQSLLLIHCGEAKAFTAKKLGKRLTDICQELIKQRIASVTLSLPAVPGQSADWQVEQMLLQIDNALYQFTPFKKKKLKLNALEAVSFHLPDASEAALQQAHQIAIAVTLTRDLANMPANICTPTYLGEQAMLLAKQYPTVQSKILERKDMQRLGMNTLLAVAQGSAQEPRLIDIQYQGGSTKAPIILVGKGITFDSGGLSIKPANAMDEMKYDMCGAATVLGVIKACAELKLPLNVTGIIPSCENLLNGHAVKPGDVVTSMSGQTVEIINTDAEGRLILADALTYAEQYKPQFVIDIATLTGAMVVALGAVRSGFMTKDDQLAQMILSAAEQGGDLAWRMPLDEDYEEAIDSPMADMLNATFDRSAGAITAACFLQRFTGEYRWAHLDIAGTAWISGKNRNATGRPVPLLARLLRHVAESN
jgi:leucyl aminopeptidase